MANSNIEDTYIGATTELMETEVDISLHMLAADQGEDWGQELDIVLRRQQQPDFLGGLMPLEVGLGKFSSDHSTLDSTTFFYVQSGWDF